MDEWEMFNGRGARHNTPVNVIKIAGDETRARFTFGAEIAERLGTHVLLRYNAGKRQIGFVPASSDTRGAYYLHVAGRATRMISAIRFFHHFNINVMSATGSYTPEYIEDMVVIQLPAPE
jgi:hypothetical protein